MSALPPDDMLSLRSSAFAARHPIESMIARWQSIEATANKLARLAGLAQDHEQASQADFVRALDQAIEWQRELAWQGVEDIEAIMFSGMGALAVLESRGQDVQIPAMALWREIHAARSSVLTMLTSASHHLDKSTC